MSDDLSVTIPLGAANAAALGLDADTLTLDLAEVEIGESVEIQRRLGLTPRGLIVGLALAPASWDALVTLAAVWLALRQAAHPTAWTDIHVKTYLPHVGPDDGQSVGKDSPTHPEPAAS